MPGAMTRDADIDVGALFASLRRNALFIIAGAVVMAALAWAICLLATPDYRAETRILIETRESIYTRPNGETATERPLLDPEGVKSQVEVVTSTDILKRVADQLNLITDPNFSSAHMGSLGHALVLLGLRNNPANLTAEERVLRVMRRNLQVFNVSGSRVIVVQYTAPDAKMAANVSNAIADAYIAQQSAAKLQSNDDATGWLAPEIEDLSKRVRDAEAKVAQYRASSDLLTGQGNATIAAQQLSEISTELSRVKANRSATEAKASSIRKALASGTPIDTLQDVMASGLMQRLSERRVQLNAEIADLSATLLEGHPRIKSLRSQLADLDQQIRSEGRKILTSFENEVAAAQAREQDLLRELNGTKAQAARAGDEEVELRALEREAAAQRELLQTYMSRYREAASRTDRNYVPADARVFSRADAPSEPYFPLTLPIVSATFVAGLLLLSIATLLIELFSGRAFVAVNGDAMPDAEEIEMPVVTAARQAAEAPPAPEKPVNLTVSASNIQNDHAQRNAAYEQKNTLAHKRDEDPNSVSAIVTQLIGSDSARALVVSPEGDAGSITTITLARLLADRKRRIILIDMTGSGAVGHSMLDGDIKHGITELLSGDKKFTDTIHSDRYSDAHIMPLGIGDPEYSMRSVDRLPIILNALETAYDIVLIECGASTANQIRRLAGDTGQIILSIVDPESALVAQAALDLDQHGFDDVLIMTSLGTVPA